MPRPANGPHPSPRNRRNGRTSALPGWNDLSNANKHTSGGNRDATLLARIPTNRFALLIISLAVLFTAYVGHVHATQDLLADVQQLRRANLTLHLKYNRLKGDFDRMVGPGVIYERANRLGLVEDVSYGPTIEVNQ